MEKKLKHIVWALIALLFLFFGGVISSNIFLKKKVEAFTNKRLPEHINAQYEGVSLHILAGTLTYTNVSVALKNKTNDSVHTYVSVAEVIVEDLSYWDYLINNEIHIEDIKLESPKITYYKSKLLTHTDSSKKKAFINLNRPLLVDELRIDNANIIFYDTSINDTLLYIPNITTEVDDILVDNTTLQKRLPLNFGNYETEADSILLKIGTYETLRVGDFILKDKEATAHNIKLTTKYSRSDYDKMLTTERDHLSVALQKLDITDINFGFNNRKFFAATSNIKIDSIDATIYRNKLIADDPTIKPLYSKILRKLPIDLTIDSISVSNSTITYQEKSHRQQPPGTIYFDNFNAELRNMSNTYPEGTKTTVALNSRVMKTAPLKANWSFDVNSPKDNFTFTSNLGVLPASSMNSFTKPNLLIELKGEIEKTQFSIYGNSAQSAIDMRIDYKNFKISLLNKNGKKKNRILSGLINIVVKKNSGTKHSKFSTGTATVAPDRTKSFFNYLWLNIAAGIKECLL